MWRIAKPSTTVLVAYRKCTGSVMDSGLKRRFDVSESAVVVADTLFRAAAGLGEFGNTKPKNFELPNVTSDEMVWLYRQKMVPKGAPGRVIYDVLRAGAKRGTCPLCGHRDVMTLDHYLPKSTYPALSVNPLNLIPSCSDCNKTKLAGTASTIHPYFDNIEDDRWLYARVVEQHPASVRFYPVAPATWSSALGDRLKSHFELLALNRLYAFQAARMLSNLRLLLSDLHAIGGADAVQYRVSDDARSYRNSSLNSWETAMFEALAASSWFCDGGFK